MGNRRIPREIKEAKIRLYEADTLPLAAILEYTWEYLRQLSIECMLSGLRRVMS